KLQRSFSGVGNHTGEGEVGEENWNGEEEGEEQSSKPQQTARDRSPSRFTRHEVKYSDLYVVEVPNEKYQEPEDGPRPFGSAGSKLDWAADPDANTPKPQRDRNNRRSKGTPALVQVQYFLLVLLACNLHPEYE